MEASVHVGYGLYHDSTTNEAGVRVDLKNIGPVPISEIKVDFAYDFETPLDVEIPATATEAGAKPLKFQEAGRSFGFGLAIGESEGPLKVGESRVYLCPPVWMKDIQSVVQSLSPERYRIQIRMDGKTETAVPGSHIGEFIQRKFAETPRFEIPKDRLQLVMNIAGNAVQLQKAFKIYPPKEVLARPEVLCSDAIIEELADTKWWLKFADGREEILSLPELIALTYNLIQIRIQFDEARLHGFKGGNLSIKFHLAINELMTPEVVKMLFEKMALEGL